MALATLGKELSQLVREFESQGFSFGSHPTYHATLVVSRNNVVDDKATARFRKACGSSEFHVLTYFNQRRIISTLPNDESGRLEHLRAAKDRIRELEENIKATNTILEDQRKELQSESMKVSVIVQLLADV